MHAMRIGAIDACACACARQGGSLARCLSADSLVRGRGLATACVHSSLHTSKTPSSSYSHHIVFHRESSLLGVNLKTIPVNPSLDSSLRSATAYRTTVHENARLS